MSSKLVMKVVPQELNSSSNKSILSLKNRNLANEDINEQNNFGNKELSVIYLQKVNDAIIDKMTLLKAQNVNELLHLRTSLLTEFETKVKPYFFEIFTHFEQLQKTRQQKIKQTKVKDLIALVGETYNQKFQNQSVQHIKEILLLWYLLSSQSEDSAQAVLVNQNQCAKQCLKELCKRQDFQDDYFDQTQLLYFEKMMQKYYQKDVPVSELAINNIKSQLQVWAQSVKIKLHQKAEHNNEQDLGKKLLELIEQNKQIRSQAISQYEKLQVQCFVVKKNLYLILMRMKAILVMGGNVSTASIIEEELLNALYKSKKRFLKGLEKIHKFQRDFTDRDQRVVQLLQQIIPELVAESVKYTAMLRENVFVDTANLDFTNVTDYIQSEQTRMVIHKDDRGNNYQVEEHYKVQNEFKYVTAAQMGHTKANVNVNSLVRLDGVAQSLQDFINQLKELLMKHEFDRKSTEEKIAQFKNDGQFIEAREKARMRKAILSGQDLQSVELEYEKDCKGTKNSAQLLKSQLDSFSYYLFPHEIYVNSPETVIKQIIQTGEVHDEAQLEKLLAAQVRDKIVVTDSCFVSNKKRIQKYLFLSYADLVEVLITSQNGLLVGKIFDIAIEGRLQLAFQFNGYAEGVQQIKSKDFYHMLAKDFASANSNGRVSYSIIQNAYQILINKFKRDKQATLLEIVSGHYGCCKKQMFGVQSIVSKMQAGYKTDIFLPNSAQSYIMKKFVLNLDFTPGSNLEFYMRYLNFQKENLAKKAFCCC